MKIGRKIKNFLIEHDIIKSTFVEDGIVFIGEGYAKPTNEYSDTVKFLGTKEYYGYFKDTDRKLTEMFELAYPLYKGYIWLY